MNEERLYSVKDVCNKYGITRKTLFYYDKSGLLSPKKREGVQNHKKYSMDDLCILERIIELRKAGVSVEDIKTILVNHKDKKLILRILKETEFQLIIHCKDVKDELRNIGILISKYEGTSNNN